MDIVKIIDSCDSRSGCTLQYLIDFRLSQSSVFLRHHRETFGFFCFIYGVV